MPTKDTRVTMKLEKAMWKRIEELIRRHPEWGVISVPDFVRRAIDAEIRSREESDTSRVINLCFSPSPDTEGRHRRAR